MSIEPQYPPKRNNGKAFAGLILLAIGVLLLLQQLSLLFLPGWVISWPMFLIVLGLYLCSRSNFRRPGGLITLAIGIVFLADNILPGIDLSRVIWPLTIIMFGFWLITRRNRQWDHQGFNKHDRFRGGNPFGGHQFTNPFERHYDPNFDPNAPDADREAAGVPPPNVGDGYIDIVSIFGGVKRTVLSKDFKGGEIVNLFGGTELDLTQADINGTVVIEIVQIFGGVKLTVPPHWQVVSDLAAIFSNVDDKRRAMQVPLSADKILVIKGVSIFAGVDVRSF